MTATVSVRLPDDLAKGLEDLAQTIDRPKAYVIKKALEAYLEDYSDYLIALQRLNDKDDEVISGDKMWEMLGVQD